MGRRPGHGHTSDLQVAPEQWGHHLPSQGSETPPCPTRLSCLPAMSPAATLCPPLSPTVSPQSGSCCPSRVGAQSFPAPCSVISDRHACGRQPQVSPTPRHQPCPPRVHGGVAVSPEAQAASTHRGVLSSLACPRQLVSGAARDEPLVLTLLKPTNVCLRCALSVPWFRLPAVDGAVRSPSRTPGGRAAGWERERARDATEATGAQASTPTGAPRSRLEEALFLRLSFFPF